MYRALICINHAPNCLFFNNKNEPKTATIQETKKIPDNIQKSLEAPLKAINIKLLYNTNTSNINDITPPNTPDVTKYFNLIPAILNL